MKQRIITGALLILLLTDRFPETPVLPLLPCAAVLVAAAFLLGFGYLAFVPFLQERVSTKFASFAATGTTVILVFQGLGAFIAPYAGTILSLFTESLNTQFLICGGLYVILSVIGFFIGE